MYSDTAPTPSAVTFVPVEKDTLGMAKNVEISTSVKTPSQLLFVWKMPNAATYQLILYVNVMKALKEMEQKNAEVRR